MINAGLFFSHSIFPFSDSVVKTVLFDKSLKNINIFSIFLAFDFHQVIWFHAQYKLTYYQRPRTAEPVLWTAGEHQQVKFAETCRQVCHTMSLLCGIFNSVSFAYQYMNQKKTYLKELNCTCCLLYLIFQFSSKSFFIALVTQIFRSDILPNTCSYLNNQFKHYPIVIQNNNSSIWIHILLN